MPLSISFPDCPALNGTYDCCKTRSGPACFTDTTYTPVNDWVFWTEAITAGNCTAYFCQYCTRDVAGTRGVSWVVEYWCCDGASVSAHLTTVVSDWECQCVGARFTFTFTGDMGCCCGTEVCCCEGVTIPNTLTVSLTGDDGMGGWEPVGDVTIQYDPDTNQWVGSGTVDGIDVAFTLLCYDAPICQWALIATDGVDEVTFEILSPQCDPLDVTVRLQTHVIWSRDLQGAVTQ